MNANQKTFINNCYETLNESGMTPEEILATGLISLEELNDLCKTDALWPSEDNTKVVSAYATIDGCIDAYNIKNVFPGFTGFEI